MATPCRVASVIKAPYITKLERVASAAADLGVAEGPVWNTLVAANNLSEVPLLPSATGDAPLQVLLGRSDNLAHAFMGFLDVPEGGAFRQFHLRRRLLRGLEERTSARNQFYCRVRLISRERVNAVVTLDLGGGDQLTAQITARSIDDLGLVSGCACHALFDPSWVEILPDTSAAGQLHGLRGTVARCRDDPVDSEVTIALAGGRLLLATMTHAERLEKEIRVGKTVCALIQASQIILAVYEALAPANRRKT